MSILVAGVGCNRVAPESDTGRQLAQVYNKSLYLSDLEGMIPEGMTAEDSSLIINAYIERWIRETLLLHEAERNIPTDLNIDEMVRNYRASLIRHNYEQMLVNELLDSTVTQAELTEFYEKHKTQYELETPIVRCNFVKLPLTAPSRQQARQWWEQAPTDTLAYARLVEYCNLYAHAHSLDSDRWYKIEQIAEQLPPGTLTSANISAKRNFQQQDDAYEYFFRTLEVISRTEIAPLSYIEDQARKVILRQRKQRLLEEKKNDMYRREMRKDNVKVFADESR